MLAAEGNHKQAAERVEAIVPEMNRDQRNQAAERVNEHRRRYGGDQ
jgi:hypothetical protein